MCPGRRERVIHSILILFFLLILYIHVHSEAMEKYNIGFAILLKFLK